MSIEPDTKDWAWVLGQRCPECGFEASVFPADQVGAQVLADLARWQRVLERPDADQRPEPGRWSAVEYACHVRDVLELFAERVKLMLIQDDPVLEDWDQNQAAVDGDYRSQPAHIVAGQLAASAITSADAFSSVPSQAWDRPAHRADGAVFTVETLLQYVVHDLVHHLHDVDG